MHVISAATNNDERMRLTVTNREMSGGAGQSHSSGTKWIRIADVMRKTSTGRTWVYTRMKDELDPFPAPMRLSARCAVWDEAQVDAWMVRCAARHARPADLVDAMKAAS